LRYGIDLQIVGPKVPTPVIPPKNAVISVQNPNFHRTREVCHLHKEKIYIFVQEHIGRPVDQRPRVCNIAIEGH
jgi:hypothetical protein